jgi:tetratricopeptide (TPR) repeat protein
MFSVEIHNEQLQLLEKVLKRDGFRFIIIGQNHRDVFIKTRDWLLEKFPQQKTETIEIYGKDYRHFMDEVNSRDEAWILIPDFERLFDKENEAFCTALNQRRDFFARNKMVLIVFLFEEKLKFMPEKIPDLWSLRTLELSFELDAPAARNPEMWIDSPQEISTLGGNTLTEKNSEIENLIAQLKKVKPDDKQLLENIHQQLGRIYYSIANYQKALFHFENSLKISQQIGDRREEGTTMNNISQIYHARGDYQTALEYLEIALKIQQEIGDKKGESVTLNNISSIYKARGNYEKAMEYSLQDLKIVREIGDKAGEGTTLNNISQIYRARGDYQTELEHLEIALKIGQEIGDKAGEGTTLNNISGIYRARGDYQTALEYLEKSLKIRQEIGDKAGMIHTFHNMAHIALEQKNVEKYLKYHTQAWQLAMETKDAMGLFQVGQSLGRNLCRFGDTKNGLEILKIAYTIGQQSGLPGTEEIGKIIAHFENNSR